MAGLLAATIGWLCEGQVRELQRMFDVSRSEESYLDAINGKTAALLLHGVPHRRAGRRPPRRTRPTGCPTSARPTAWPSRSSTTSTTSSPPPRRWASPSATTSGPASTPCRSSGPSPTDPDGELAELLGRPLDDAEQARAKELVLGGPHVATSVATAVDYIEEATALLDSLPVAASVDGLRSAAKNLLSSLPD